MANPLQTIGAQYQPAARTTTTRRLARRLWGVTRERAIDANIWHYAGLFGLRDDENKLWSRHLISGGNIVLKSVFGLFFILSVGTAAVAQQLEPGSLGEPLRGDKQVWISRCPQGTRPISGTCFVDGPSTSRETLHAVGAVANENAWLCNWTAPVQASVQAWCMKTPRQ
jgi:hypothetical protein